MNRHMTVSVLKYILFGLILSSIWIEFSHILIGNLSIKILEYFGYGIFDSEYTPIAYYAFLLGEGIET